MLILTTRLTPGLRRWLEGAHDDGRSPLVVVQTGEHIAVTRADGSEPSETERLEVTALLAAHAAEPLR